MVILTWGPFCSPEEIWQCLKMFWVVTTKGGEMLPAASGERPGMPLNTLQGPGRPAQQPQQLRGRELIGRTSSWHVVEPRHSGQPWTRSPTQGQGSLGAGKGRLYSSASLPTPGANLAAGQGWTNWLSWAWGGKKTLGTIVVMVVHGCECTSRHSTVCFKMVQKGNFMSSV